MSSKHQMIINYVPGEECRVAIVEDGKLEELHAEKFTAASRVGNIYVGRVNNVEASIQAAFVDFGIEENGFLHISDLHPRYFPGEDGDATEQVGHKTPRRERPPIQQCLRKGDEVIVQVLKEGVGTKGPTLTSYLSIPGRFLVMMPQMDKVGVSRKVEDEDLRRKMREILDQLDLPEGFGFILRTAGMDRSKLELKRDLAYLQRLWKDMERRRKGGNKARLLYSESDLLVRCLRDVLTSETDEVIIDNEQALSRAERFMKIVAPRTKTKLMHCPGKTPIFHSFGIERQIALIHAREVPLPSGGRLVIDQTEALVAIDVNSGKSRDARDAEDNAYKTNIEAVDEICRQLRLRDLGGIVVNDMIDMRAASHRKDIENRFKERLKRDRAKTTVATISPFGILEMTRQRMRSSHEQVHFSDCPVCRGRGLVQKPDSVASESLRELAAILDYERISKVEMVVSPRVAGELLSNKRRLLNRIERESGKHVDVRVSEDIPPDRISFYAYDPAAERSAALQAEADAERALDTEPSDAEPHPIEIDAPDADDDGPISANLDGEGGRRRRRRRGGRGRGRDGQDAPAGRQPQQAAQPPRPPQQPRPKVEEAAHDHGPAEGAEPAGDAADGEAGEGGRRRRRRRRRRGGRGGSGEGAENGQTQSAGSPNAQPAAGQNQRPSGPRPAHAAPRHTGHGDENPLAIVTSMGDHGDEPAEPQNHAPRNQHDDQSEHAEHNEPVEHAGEAPTDGVESDGDQDGAPGEAGEPTGEQTGELAGNGENGPGEGGRRRRRRRRRGGRGGGPQGGSPEAAAQGAPQSGSQNGAPAQNRNNPPREGQREGQREGSRDGQKGGQRDGRRDGQRRDNQSGGRGRDRQGGDGRSRDSRPAAETPPTPKAPPAEAPPAKPAVRPLYFNRRKLTPAEMNKRPKPE